MSHFRLPAEPVASTRDDALFIDATAGAIPPPSGEEQTRELSGPPPPDDVAPEVVLSALYAATKAGAATRWEPLDSPLSVWLLDDAPSR